MKWGFWCLGASRNCRHSAIVQLSLMRKDCFCNNTCIDILLVNATKREI